MGEMDHILVNPSFGKQANKLDQGKLRYDLIPALCEEKLAEVYTMGAAKYKDWGYMDGQGLEYSRLYGATLRHLKSFWKGEANDTASGLPHLAHAAWGCFSLLLYELTEFGIDNRPVHGSGIRGLHFLSTESVIGKEQRFCDWCSMSLNPIDKNFTINSPLSQVEKHFCNRSCLKKYVDANYES